MTYKNNLCFSKWAFTNFPFSLLKVAFEGFYCSVILKKRNNEDPCTHHPSLEVKHYKLTKIVEAPLGSSLILIEFPPLPLPEITILSLVFGISYSYAFLHTFFFLY